MLTKEQLTHAANAAFALLFDIGLRKNLQRFFVFKESLEKKIQCKISDGEYTRILNMVNQLSWERYKCLFTSIIICTNCLPGMPLFKKAFSLGAITVLPNMDDHSLMRQLADKLQKQVYDAAGSSPNAGSTKRVLPKAPALF